MDEDAHAANQFSEGDLLLWQVGGDSVNDAETLARDMASKADSHQLGEWSVVPIGLGQCWWFDLTLARDVDAPFLLLLFDRLPDRRY